MKRPFGCTPVSKKKKNITNSFLLKTTNSFLVGRPSVVNYPTVQDPPAPPSNILHFPPLTRRNSATTRHMELPHPGELPHTPMTFTSITWKPTLVIQPSLVISRLVLTMIDSPYLCGRLERPSVTRAGYTGIRVGKKLPKAAFGKGNLYNVNVCGLCKMTICQFQRFFTGSER
jgi:hypothetical protein